MSLHIFLLGDKGSVAAIVPSALLTLFSIIYGKTCRPIICSCTGSGTQRRTNPMGLEMQNAVFQSRK